MNEGAHVFITGRRDAELTAAAKEIGRNVTGVQRDEVNGRNRMSEALSPIFVVGGTGRHGGTGAYVA